MAGVQGIEGGAVVPGKRPADLSSEISEVGSSIVNADKRQCLSIDSSAVGVREEEAAGGGDVPRDKPKQRTEERIVLVQAAAAEDKGSRHTMEDVWVIKPGSDSDAERGKLRCEYFAVFDGHGGRQAADFAATHLHSHVLASDLPLNKVDVRATKKAIAEGFRKTDEALLKESTAAGWQDGATAVCVWVIGQTAFVANVGDAKAVLGRVTAPSGDAQTGTETGGAQNDAALKGVIVTREHKAIFPPERARIQKAGGFVGENGRLQGRLEVSRAFGDRTFKKVGVIAVPDIQAFQITEKERFIILGCDGLWGVFGPSDAVEFVDEQFKGGASIQAACRRLVRHATLERKCKDNCTALLVKFDHS